MRYRETGPVPNDFRRVTNGTIRYLRKTYGVALLGEAFRRQTTALNKALSEGTPFEILTEDLGNGRVRE